MKSEIIFSYHATWRGRWGDEHGKEMVIGANFDNPAVWPYTLKKKEFDVNEDTYQEEVTEEKTIKLSKALYEKLKQTVEKNSGLRSCEESIENGVMDGTCEEYYFSCNAFSKRTGGLSIYSGGSYEADEYAPSKRTDNYVVYKAMKDLEGVLQQEGIELF